MKILLLEDEPKIAQALKNGLKQERFTVELFGHGENALAAALADDYDAIILDRMVPGHLDGLEICQKIRAAGINTPILLLTAKGQVRDRIDGLNSGADDYLVKPFSFDELLARIRALLRRPQATLTNLLQIDDLTLDTVTFEVRRGDTPIHLSQTEFSLLEYLMRHRGQVLSKNNLIAHVWDFDADVLPNTVEAYIGYLRSKIDKPFPRKPALIRTVRGFGYKIGSA